MELELAVSENIHYEADTHIFWKGNIYGKWGSEGK